MDFLAVQGTLKSLLQHHSSKASILWHSAFFTVQLSHPYMTTGRPISLTRWTFVGKVMSLLLNMLSRLVITLLPRSKRLLISWLQSPSAVILGKLSPNRPKWHIDYLELKLQYLRTSQCQKDILTLPSVSLKAGNKSQVKGALPASGIRKTLIARDRKLGHKASINKLCYFFNLLPQAQTFNRLITNWAPQT